MMLFHAEISDGSNMSFLRRADEWVLKGISGYIYGLYLKKTFGVNDYRHWIKEVKDFVSRVGLGVVQSFFIRCQFQCLGFDISYGTIHNRLFLDTICFEFNFNYNFPFCC